MRVPPLRTTAYLAFIMPVFFSLMWIMSATIDGKWAFGVNSLSDMGISENAVSAFLFNFGCIMTGIFGSMIGFGMYTYGKKTVSVGGLFYIISMIFLALVGVFTLNIFPMHFTVASTFGVMFAVSVVTISVSDWKLSWYFYFDIIFMVAGTIVIVTQPFAVWEAIAVIGAMVWTVIIGYKMMKREEQLYGETPRIGGI